MKEILLIIKKSKFYAYKFELNSHEEFLKFFEQIKLNHKKATHFCFAYKIKQNGEEKIKFDDSTEPANTAGRPILSVIEKKKLQNICVVVVRYFGKIKLGAGGLVRAYTKATSMVLENEN